MTLAHQTLASAVIMTASDLVFLGLAVFGGLKAWRLDSDQYLLWIQSHRPRNWRSWPIFGSIWLSVDSRPTTLLWQNRLLSLLAVGMGLAGLIFGVLAILRA